jgi:hypothetical protein
MSTQAQAGGGPGNARRRAVCQRSRAGSRGKLNLIIAVARAGGGPKMGQRGGLLSSWGGFVIRIRILMYREVSCVYPEGYMYP